MYVSVSSCTKICSLVHKNTRPSPSMYKNYRLLSAVFCFGLFCSAAKLAAQDGPTDFPSSEDPSAWPGAGVIRVFPFMMENRKYFWSQRSEKQHATVVIGDALSGEWSDLTNTFPKMNIANRSIGGDTTRGLLFRLKEDALDLHPNALVIVTGTNDLSAKESPADALSNIAAMLDMAHKAMPTLPIILCTLPPRDNPDASIDNSQLDELNDGIKALAKSKPNVTLLDLHAVLLKPNGAQDVSYFQEDKLRLSAAGYAKWHDALVPIFTKLNVR